MHWAVDLLLILLGLPLACWCAHKSDQHWDAAERILHREETTER